jgi:antitoxin component HigA of HigAB toxin-antitoxin module
MIVTPGKKRAAVTRDVAAIRSEKELAEATREVCDLMSLQGSLSSANEQRFQTLVDLIEKYERVHHPIPEPSHAAILRHVLDTKTGGVQKLAEVTGISRGIIAAILAGKLEMGSQEAEKFAKYFHVETSVFAIDGGSVAVEVIGKAGQANRRISTWFQFEGRSAAESRSTPEHVPPLTRGLDFKRAAFQPAVLKSVAVCG